MSKHSRAPTSKWTWQIVKLFFMRCHRPIWNLLYNARSTIARNSGCVCHMASYLKDRSTASLLLATSTSLHSTIGLWSDFAVSKWHTNAKGNIELQLDVAKALSKRTGQYSHRWLFSRRSSPHWCSLYHQDSRPHRSTTFRNPPMCETSLSFGPTCSSLLSTSLKSHIHIHGRFDSPLSQIIVSHLFCLWLLLLIFSLLVF